ncbi:UV excision repair protein RAD23 homolog A-like [Lucilia sericata]|uniref:UV excision repair protein RAD23 homolog A-like n=1 Tax=Lucilia sericata TaxID=13632 RepID=UPI0018A85845|nr:UV excision repair protein RAD23 homolog A-like [Lucilia sericata]
MKLQIKTLNQKSLVVDIEETKTVYELKKELSLYPDIGVRPELQKLIYAGKILVNDDKLSTYNIDVKKFLVIMILKQPVEEPPKAEQQAVKEETVKDIAADKVKEQEKTESKNNETTTTSPATPVAEAEFKTPTAPTGDSKKDELVAQIMGMGYPEADVRRALAASFYNPDRAVEYLIEGIPTSPSTPEGESYSDTDADLSMTPFEVFRGDPTFQTLRQALQQHPELLDAAIQRVGETNPELLNLISENQQEFLSMLVDGSDDEEYDDDDLDDDEDE